jgi:hypothetical protein
MKTTSEFTLRTLYSDTCASVWSEVSNNKYLFLLVKVPNTQNSYLLCETKLHNIEDFELQNPPLLDFIQEQCSYVIALNTIEELIFDTIIECNVDYVNFVSPALLQNFYNNI